MARCTLISSPSFALNGNTPPTQTFVYHVQLDTTVYGDEVLLLARNLQPNPIPAFGHARVTKTNHTIYALDWDVRYLLQGSDTPDDLRNHLVTVTYRQPDPGNDEQPGTILQPPLSRDAEYWVEFVDSPSETYVAREVTNRDAKTVSSTFGVMTNSAGEIMPSIQNNGYNVVVVEQKNVSSAYSAVGLNSTFGNTVNGSDWSVLGSTVGKHQARFLRAETGQPLYYNGQKYYRQQTRVEISSEPFYIERFNEGTYWINPFSGDREFEFNLQGVPWAAPFPLKADGAPATETSQYLSKYFLRHTDADYSGLGFSTT